MSQGSAVGGAGGVFEKAADAVHELDVSSGDGGSAAGTNPAGVGGEGDVCSSQGDPAAGAGFRIDNQEVTAQDLATLAPEQYLNDKVINAFLGLLRARIAVHKGGIFIASTYLFTKLYRSSKQQKAVAPGAAAADAPAATPNGAPEQPLPPLEPIRAACTKWYNKQQLLTIHKWFVLPVNHSKHWSLIVVVNASAYLAQHTPPALLPTHLRPPPPHAARPVLIASFDSLGFSYRSAMPTIALYLAHRWMKEIGHPDEVAAANDLAHKIMRDLPIRRARLPAQENSYDCGCFMLHYLDLLTMPGVAHVLELHPTYWLSSGLAEWFTPAEAEAKRDYLAALFKDLRDVQRAKKCDAAATGKFVKTSACLQKGVREQRDRMKRECRFLDKLKAWEANADDAASSSCMSAFESDTSDSGADAGPAAIEMMSLSSSPAAMEVIELDELEDVKATSEAKPKTPTADDHRAKLRSNKPRATPEELARFNQMFQQPRVAQQDSSSGSASDSDSTSSSERERRKKRKATRRERAAANKERAGATVAAAKQQHKEKKDDAPKLRQMTLLGAPPPSPAKPATPSEGNRKRKLSTPGDKDCEKDKTKGRGSAAASKRRKTTTPARSGGKAAVQGGESSSDGDSGSREGRKGASAGRLKKVPVRRSPLKPAAKLARGLSAASKRAAEVEDSDDNAPRAPPPQPLVPSRAADTGPAPVTPPPPPAKPSGPASVLSLLQHDDNKPARSLKPKCKTAHSRVLP